MVAVVGRHGRVRLAWKPARRHPGYYALVVPCLPVPPYVSLGDGSKGEERGAYAWGLGCVVPFPHVGAIHSRTTHDTKRIVRIPSPSFP